MKLKKYLIIALLSTSKCFALIYGKDDRVETYQSSSKLFKRLAASSVTIIKKDKFEQDILPNGKKIYKLKLQENLMKSSYVCQEERFAQQETASYCSAFYIGNRKIVTAGHCISGLLSCQDHYYVFDYKLNEQGEVNRIFNDSQVYECSELVAAKEDFGAHIDYAVLKLTRDVTGRDALKINKKKVRDHSELVIIGNPLGLPQKIADNGKVLGNENNPFFYAELDAYSGNSGSAVFNASTGEVEGILTNGRVDFDYMTLPNHSICALSHVCDSDYCREGVVVNRIEQILPFLED